MGRSRFARVAQGHQAERTQPVGLCRLCRVCNSVDRHCRARTAAPCPSALLRVVAREVDARPRLWRCMRMSEWDWTPLVHCLDLTVGARAGGSRQRAQEEGPYIRQRGAQGLRPGS